MKLVELKIIGLSYSQTQVGSYVLVLSEKGGKKKLPIIINQEYAQYIALKIEKMKTKNNDTITLTIDLIEGICNSQFYDSENNYLKVYSILNILLSVLENTISHSEGVCNSINGALKGLSFEGKIEP